MTLESSSLAKVKMTLGEIIFSTCAFWTFDPIITKEVKLVER